MLASAEHGGASGQSAAAAGPSPRFGAPPRHEGTPHEARRGLAHALSIFVQRHQRQHSGLQKLKGGQVSWAEESLGMLVADLQFVDEPFGFVCNALIALLDEPALRSPGANAQLDGGGRSWVTDAFSALVTGSNASQHLRGDCRPAPSDGGWVADAFTALVSSSAMEPAVARQPQLPKAEMILAAHGHDEVLAMRSGSWVARAFEAFVAGGIHPAEAAEVAAESSEQQLGWVSEAFSALVNGLRTRS